MLNLICREVLLVTLGVIDLTHLKNVLDFILEQICWHVNENSELRVLRRVVQLNNEWLQSRKVLIVHEFCHEEAPFIHVDKSSSHETLILGNSEIDGKKSLINLPSILFWILSLIWLHYFERVFKIKFIIIMINAKVFKTRWSNVS